MNSVSEFSKEKYDAASEFMGPKLAQAQADYAPQLDQAKMNYDIARMYANGWINESVSDNSKISFVTEFEKMLPLRNISLIEFERRIKRLVTPAMEDKVTVRMVIESFCDHWAFLDIRQRDSLTSELLFDEIFYAEEDESENGSQSAEAEEDEEKFLNKELYVPHLMLLGLLYCRSNRALRAEKFYELVEIELTEAIKSNDPEFMNYVPYMYEIAYKLMFRLYVRHHDQTPGVNGRPPKQPKIGLEELQNFVPTDDFEACDKLRKRYQKVFNEDLFQAKTRLTRVDFVKRLTNMIFNLLQPHDIRVKAYDNFQNLETL